MTADPQLHRAAGVEKMARAMVLADTEQPWEYDEMPNEVLEYWRSLATAALAAWEAHNEKAPDV